MSDTMTGTETTTDTIVLPYTPELLAGAYAVALHASKDDVTPIITAVQVSAQYFLATDKYTIGRFEHTAGTVPADANETTVYVSRVAVEWLAKQSLRVLDWAHGTCSGLTVVFERDSVSVRFGDQILVIKRFSEVKGNFPPVGRLLDGLEAATDALPVALDPVRLERFTKGAVKVLDKNVALRMEQTASSNPNKPGLVLVSFGNFYGCIQPNLLLR